MNTITCEGCGADVARGHAHIRSRSFTQVGWCHPCWALRSIAEPSQRPAPPLTTRRLSA